MPPGAIYVGRPGEFGNPFAHEDTGVAVAMYGAWLRGGLRTARMTDCRKVLSGPLHERRARILANMHWLRGKHLACWCRLDQPCHADVLLEIANA